MLRESVVRRGILTAASFLVLIMLVGCQGLVKAPPPTPSPTPTPTPAPPPPPPATLQTSINHIVVMAQENRSFDSYFGTMHQFWAQNG